MVSGLLEFFEGKLGGLIAMDMRRHWFGSSSRREGTQNINLGRSYTRPHYRSNSPGNYDGRKTVWQMLWRKLRRNKKKVFSSSTPSPSIVDGGGYDEETYSMNFDEGTGWMDPDNLPRSFSARFAHPSRI